MQKKGAQGWANLFWHNPNYQTEQPEFSFRLVLVLQITANLPVLYSLYHLSYITISCEKFQDAFELEAILKQGF